MKKTIIRSALLLVSMTLAACSTTSWNPWSESSQKNKHAMQGHTAEATGTSTAASGEAVGVGGGVSHAMDANDRTKLSRALDKPVGKSTQWVNANTNVTYTVVPTQKVVINGNPYCRKYTVTATSGGNSHEMSGTACVSANSNWEAVGG